MSRSNAGVNFVLKSPHAEVSPIKAIFCFNHTQFYYYEKKLSIPPKFWNKNNKRAKETRSFACHIELNATLNCIESAILTCYRRYKNDNKEEPTVDILREMVKVERGFSVAEKDKPIELMNFIQSFIADAEQGKHINLSNGKPVTIVTVRTYKQTYKLLQAFEQQYKRKLTFKDINPMFHKQFIHFIRQEFKSIETGKSLSINTAGKHITNIKTFMGVANERKLTTSLDFRMKSFKVISELVDKIYLSADEIQALHDHDFSANKRLERFGISLC